MALVTSTSSVARLSRVVYTQSDGQTYVSVESGTIPDGFPTALTTGFVWNGARLTDEEQYTYRLADIGILEIDAALAFFKALELDGDLVTQETFPLPTLRSVLHDLCDELHNGRGFFVLRGLDAEKYSVEDSTIIFLGLQAYIAEQRARQDDSGNMIVHIISDSSTASSPMRDLHSRHSKKSITFHTEETGDIIAWQTRNTAARGGSCIISSSHTIYNILANTRPDVINTLAQPNWPFALPTFHLRPILYHHASHVLINFCRASLLGSAAHPRPAHLPPLTPAQHEALDILESVARGVELKIKTRRGDFHFVNNLTLLHRRDDFVDDEDEVEDDEKEEERREDKKEGGKVGEDKKQQAGIMMGEETGDNSADDTMMMDMTIEKTEKKTTQLKRKRHLVRMRLRNKNMGWQLPAELETEWRKVFETDAGVEPVWHLEPMPEGFFPLRKYPL